MSIVFEQELELNEAAYMIANQIEADEVAFFLDQLYNKLPVSKRTQFNGFCEQFVEMRLKPKAVRWEDCSISGNMFVLSGDFDLGKKYWQTYILKRFGIVKSSINKNVSYLVVENGKLNGTESIKQKEARKLGIPIIDIQTLRKMR